MFNIDSEKEFLKNDFDEVSAAVKTDDYLPETLQLANSFLEQISLEFAAPNRQQLMLTGLATFMVICPDYFSQKDLACHHRAILTSHKGEIDRIYDFLNEPDIRDFCNSKSGRSTVFNRVQTFKTILSASLLDYPVEIRQQGIKLLVEYLLGRYRALTGGRNDD